VSFFPLIGTPEHEKRVDLFELWLTPITLSPNAKNNLIGAYSITA